MAGLPGISPPVVASWLEFLTEQDRFNTLLEEQAKERADWKQKQEAKRQAEAEAAKAAGDKPTDNDS